MKINIEGFDSGNRKLSSFGNPISFKQHIGKLGFENSFTIKFSENIASNLAKIKLSIDDGKPFLGYVNMFEKVFDRNGFMFTIKLNSYFSLIYENEVRPGLYEQMTPTILVKKFIEPYGIKLADELKSSKTFINARINNFYVNFGMTAFDAIQLFFNSAFFMDAMITKDGFLRLAQPSKNFKTIGKDTNKYISLKLLEDRSFVFSKIYMSYKNNTFISPKDENLYARDYGIKREKYIKTQEQWEVLPCNGSLYLTRLYNQNVFCYEVVLPQYLDIYPLDIVKLRDPFGNEFKGTVKSVKFSINEKGALTKIKLKRHREFFKNPSI